MRIFHLVSGIFDAPFKSDIDSIFSTAGRISSLIDIMNYKFNKNDFTEIAIGIDLAYGRALMIKAGYKGSGINEIIWMGDVVNIASKLASYGNKEYSDRELMVSSGFHHNLSDKNKELLEWNRLRDCYHGTVVSTFMDNWYKHNCK